MITPQKITARLADRQDYNDRYSQYHFELVQPFSLENEAGQYVLLQVDPTTSRAYSMTDRPDIDSSFELLVDHQPAGKGTTFLRQLPLGASADFIAPLGHFVIKDNPNIKNFCFVATGSGIAPFKSILTDRLQLRNDQRSFTLFWGMRHDNELFWLDFFWDLQKNFPNFNFVPVVSQPSPSWQLTTGHVTDQLAKLDFTSDTKFYLCGNPTMVNAVKTLLLTDKHQDLTQIIIEQFGN